MKLKDNYLLFLILVCICIFFVNLDAIYVNIMEARNFATAREMIHLDHWILTTLNDEPRYEKPPLPTWLTAISMMLFGIKNLFALRLPAAIMGSLGVIFLYRMGKDLTGNKQFAFISGLIASTSFYILYSGRDGQWDIHTHSFMIIGIFFLYRMLMKKKKIYQHSVIAGIMIGCSFLSKGPVSIYALLLPFLITFGVIFKEQSWKDLWKPLLICLGVGILVAAPWSLYVYLEDTRAVERITNKESGRWLNYNVRPFYYYWSFVVQSGIWTIPAFVSLLYPYLKDRVFNKKIYTFTLIWTLGVVILLSLIPEKKSRYLLPVLFPLALNTGFYIEYLFRNFKMMGKKEALAVYFNFGLIALIGLLFPIAGSIYFNDQISGIGLWFVLTSISLVLIGGFIIYFLSKKKVKPVFFLTVGFIISLIFFGLPMARSIEENPDYTSITVVDEYTEKGNLPVFEFSSFTPEMIWEYGKPIKRLRNGENYEIPKEEEFLLLATEGQQQEMKEVFSEYSIEKIQEIDMNPVGNKHKERLYRDLFHLKKKIK